jgi:hypothetical protein
MLAEPGTGVLLFGSEGGSQTAIYSASLERIRINGSGNVGIGTTSPAYRLDVNGTIGFAYSGSNANYIEQANGAFGYGRIRPFNTSGLFAFDTNYTLGGGYDFAYNGSSVIRVTSTGNVGIGTTSPADKLYVGDSSGTSISISTNNAAGSIASPLNVDLNFRGYLNGKMAMIRSWDESSSTADGYLTFWTNDFTGGVNVFTEKMRITPTGNVGIGTDAPSQKLHVTGNVRVTGAYYDSNNEAGTSGQVLSSTGTGTDWVTPATTTASSLYDLLPAARVAYNWTGQVVNDTWTTIFSKSDNILTTGTWMVQMYINDFAVGGGHYTYTYTGVMQWYQETVNQTGEAAFSEIYLHRMGHAANASVLYLRTAESAAAAGNLGYFQIKGNYSNTSNTTINFKFVKIF